MYWQYVLTESEVFSWLEAVFEGIDALNLALADDTPYDSSQTL